MRLEFIVPASQDGRKLKSCIRSYKGISASLWKRIKWDGRVTIDGVENRNANIILHEGNVVVCEWEESSDIIPSDRPVDILYEDPFLLVANKSVQMLIHPTSRGVQDTLVNAVAGYFQRESIVSGIHPIYRLDRNTTGVVVVAKSARIQHALSKTHDRIYREYIAIAEGNITEDSGIIDEPVGRKEGSIVEWTVRRDGKIARTEFAVIERNENFTVLRLHLLTGRTHQIRVHLSHAGHPLLGDDLYGGDIRLIDRQALHAFSVRFTHPETGETLYFEAPLPEDMQKLITLKTEKMMKYSE